MATGFTRKVPVIFHVPTASGSLIAVSSGANTAGHVGIDKLQGDGTGYTNSWTDYTVQAHFIPGTVQEYDKDAGGYRFLGQCSIKLDTRYLGLVNSGSHLTIGSVSWDYKRLDVLGEGFGNDRIVLALNRR